jgi:ubiquitin-conjugating enzyme E2 N
VQGLLSTPNPEDPLDEEVAKLWKENKKKALRLAKESTERYAKAKQQP